MKPCNGCGRCCEAAGNGGLSASPEDIEHWHRDRPDIARYARGSKIWVDPATGEYLARCPWLEYTADGSMSRCGIYFDRPEDCRHYPVEVGQMIRDDCEMLEAKDRRDHAGAQQRLDVLMMDSRPPLGGWR
jgi:Fe-S-cluster containining protein